MPKHTPARITYRLLSGRPLDGRTGFPYLSPGEGRLPGWKRQAYRLGIPAAAGAAFAEPTYTTVALTALAGIGVVKLKRRFSRRKFSRAYTRPTLAALRHALGDAEVRLSIDPSLGNLTSRLFPPLSQGERELRAWYAKRVEPLTSWAPDRVWRVWAQAKRRALPVTSKLERWRRPVKDYGPSITFSAPGSQWLTEDQRGQVAAIIAGKVPVADLTSPSWDTVGADITARWTVRKRPPKAVGRADFDARTNGLPDHVFWLGLGAGGQSTRISLKADSPHIGISAASGAGKSVLAMLLIVQTLQRGGEVFILDIKGSHRWALGLPGVTYCRTDQEIHDAWVSLGKLARDRNDLAFTDPEAEKSFRRVLVVAEELNGMMDALSDYWADERESSRDRDPAMRGMRDILRMGRSALINVVAIAQRLSAAASGNGDARENLGGGLCLAKFSASTWRMLCEGLPMPRASSAIGRWFIVAGGEVTETQACLLDEWDARTMVIKSAPAPSSAVSPGARNALMGDNQDFPRGSTPTEPAGDMPQDPLSVPVTLRQAVDQGVLPWKFEASKKRLQRAKKAEPPSAPEIVGQRGQAELYLIADLIVWAESERVS